MEKWQEYLKEASEKFEHTVLPLLEKDDYKTAVAELWNTAILVERAKEKMVTMIECEAKTHTREFFFVLIRLHEIIELLSDKAKRENHIKALCQAAKNRLDLVAISAGAGK